MITFKTKLGDMLIPSGYNEITVEQLKKIQAANKDPVRIFELITNFSKDQLVLMDLDPVVPHLDFLKKPILESVETSEEIKIKGKVYVLKDPGLCEWGQKEMACQFASKGDHYSMLSTYLQPIMHKSNFDDERVNEVSASFQQLSVDSVFGCIKYINDALVAILEQEKNTLPSDPSPEMIDAGVKEFNQLGVFNNIDMICCDWGMSPEDVLRIPYNVIYLKMLKTKISGKFEKRYSEIMQRKSKLKT